MINRVDNIEKIKQLLINETTNKQGNETMNNETRKALIKSLIGTYYRMELTAPEYQSGHETYERLEIEMQKLMTENEWETFLNCNEFDNTYWSDI